MGKRFQQEVTGNDSVGEGHHLSVDVFLSDSGQVDAKFTLDNHVALTGFCATAQLWFLDGQKNILAKVGPSPRWCVDGNLVFWGVSHRTDVVNWQIDAALVPNIQMMSLTATDPGKDITEQEWIPRVKQWAKGVLA